MVKCDKCGKEVLVQNSLKYLFYFDTLLRIQANEPGQLSSIVKKFPSPDPFEQQHLESLATAREKHLNEVHLEIEEYALQFERTDRHLLPENGCEGSPSAYQYFEGYPKDNRSGAVYEERKVIRARNAYAALQEWCKQKTEVLC